MLFKASQTKLPRFHYVLGFCPLLLFHPVINAGLLKKRIRVLQARNEC